MGELGERLLIAAKEVGIHITLVPIFITKVVSKKVRS